MYELASVIPSGVETRLKCPFPINPGVYGCRLVVCKTKVESGTVPSGKTATAIRKKSRRHVLFKHI
jgi:hypothetical protein